MKLSEILGRDSVRIPLESETKEDVLRELVELLPSSSDADAFDRLYQAVLERENQMSTGIGQGIAIPHGKSDLVSQTEIAFGIARHPIEFEALDGDPVDILFCLVSPPDMTGPHIKALAQISRMLSSEEFRRSLSASRSAEEVLELFRREESVLDE